MTQNPLYNNYNYLFQVLRDLKITKSNLEYLIEERTVKFLVDLKNSRKRIFILSEKGLKISTDIFKHILF